MKQKVVGYIRVSTHRQAEEGISLEEQAHMLRGYCHDRKLELLTIEEDDCSAAGARGHLHRPGLRQSIRMAKEQDAAILLPSVDRLARHPGVLSDIFESNIPVISVAERRRVGRKTLERLIDRARHERDEIARRAREGMARAKKRGVKLGNTTNLDVAQRRGAISNLVRAERKVHELADFLERTPGSETMTLRELVETVNRSGPHNLISETRDERRPWTVGSIRKPMKKARAELQRRKEMASEDVTTTSGWGWDSAQDDGAVVSVRDADRAVTDDDDLPAEIAYGDHPGFGRF